ncbi:MAG: radical SAM protein [Clostridia bacterium]|nr:radical SAM protein [Clostridia bacterium]
MDDIRVRDLFGIRITDAIRFGAALSHERPRAAKGLQPVLAGQAGREALRARSLRAGLAVPPLLILSLTRACNLLCAGCYSHARHETATELSDPALRRLYAEADALGVSVVMLAGGEPMMRPAALEAAAEFPGLLFTVFTNGLLIDEERAAFFARYPHVLPVLSLEGGREETDARRGDGTHQGVLDAMARLDAAGAVFGVSVTTTRENLAVATGDGFTDDLWRRGVRFVFYVEYVPQNDEDALLALDPMDKRVLLRSLERQEKRRNLLLIAFPGDEEATGGCLASGRGFIHVDVDGNATPCPFAPYADANVTDGLEHALRSPFLARVREHHNALGEGTGGCTLWSNRELVRSWLADPVVAGRRK